MSHDMNPIKTIIIGAWLVITILFVGCSASKENSEEQEETTPPQAVKTETKKPPQPESKFSQTVDTVSASVQKESRPSYEAKTIPSTPPSEVVTVKGKYTVQIGAYKMPDNAERVASLARERYNSKSVYTIPDKINNLYKVMIGDFMTSDEARDFRDQMARVYPSDYKDAWVSEIPQE